MTVQDIIRKLHNDGKKVIAYDLFIVDDLDTQWGDFCQMAVCITGAQKNTAIWQSS